MERDFLPDMDLAKESVSAFLTAPHMFPNHFIVSFMSVRNPQAEPVVMTTSQDEPRRRI
jgi:hypothetical protein